MNTIPSGNNTVPATSKKRTRVLAIAVAIAVLAAGGFVASRMGIDKNLAKQTLDEAIAKIQEDGRAAGRDIQITYGELEVAGGFTGRHVVVHNPEFSIKPLEQKPYTAGTKPPIDSLVITTPTLMLYPEAVDFSALRFEAPEPINFAAQDAPEKSLLKITNNTPMKLSIADVETNGLPSRRMKYSSPTKIELVYLHEQKAEGAEDATPSVVPVYKTLQVEVGEGSVIESDIATDGSNLGKANVNFTNIVLKPEGISDSDVRIDTASIQWSNVLNEKKQNTMNAIVFFGPLQTPKTLLPYAPITFTMDVAFTGSMGKSPESVAALQSEPSVLDIKKFRFSATDADFSVAGNFATEVSESLPVGKVKIAIVSVPFFLDRFRQFGLLTPTNEGIVIPMIELLGGFPIDKLQNMTFDIERAKGGSFKIGYTTFEELFALFLKQAMQQRSGAADDGSVPAAKSPAPVLPPADKPKTKPIAAPEAGTRG